MGLPLLMLLVRSLRRADARPAFLTAPAVAPLAESLALTFSIIR
jgi:hypothetical protein